MDDVHVTQSGPNELEVTLSKQRVPELTRVLVASGCAIHAIEPKRKLEDYFIKTIQA
jgi:hypothetical protein